MVASVEADKDKSTNNGEGINRWNWNLLLSQWLGQQPEARLRSMDLIPLKLDLLHNNIRD